MSTKLYSITAGVLVIFIAATVVDKAILKPAMERASSMAFATERVIEAYSPYHDIISEYGTHSIEASEAAEKTIQRILSASDTKTALAYMMAINIAIPTGKGSPGGVLHEGYRVLSDAEVMRFLEGTLMYWDEFENERINSIITIESESGNLLIPPIPLVEIELEFRNELRFCLDTLQDRVLGKTVNFILDKYLDRNDCFSRK